MRPLRTRLTYANVMATIAVFIALGGSSYAALTITGRNVQNSSLTGIDVKNSSLTGVDVKNGSLLAADFGAGQLPTGPQGPKGERGEAGAQGAEGPKGDQGDQGDPCLSSDPACRGPEGPAGADGDDGAPGPSAQWLNVNIPNNTSTDRVVGAWTLRFQCSGPSTHRLFHIAVPTGSGGIQLSGVKTIDDSPGTTIPFATGSGTPNSGIVAAVGVNHPNPNNTSGHFYRMNGSVVLHDGLGATTVAYDMFLENRNNEGTCHFRGTAVHSGLIR